MRLRSQNYTVLEDNELWPRKDNEGHLCVFLEAQGGWDICALWDSNRKGKRLKTKGVKFVVQDGLDGTAMQFWESRKVTEIWNCAMQLPWRKVTMYWAVPVTKVTSLRVETA